MFNSYNVSNPQEVNINAVSGTIVNSFARNVRKRRRKMHIELKDNFTSIWINGVEYEPKSKRPPSGKYPSDICEKCGNESFKTTNSRNKDGYRMRDKKCLICGYRWRTIEYRYRDKGRPPVLDDNM